MLIIIRFRIYLNFIEFYILNPVGITQRRRNRREISWLRLLFCTSVGMLVMGLTPKRWWSRLFLIDKSQLE